MKVLSNLLGLNKKIAASEIALKVNNKIRILDEYISKTILYENDTENNNNIILNDNIENYECIEIYYHNNDQFYNSERIYDPANKIIALSGIYINNLGTNLVFKIKTIKINNKNLSIVGSQETTIYNKTITHQNSSDSIFIDLIIGYK